MPIATAEVISRISGLRAEGLTSFNIGKIINQKPSWVRWAFIRYKIPSPKKVWSDAELNQIKQWKIERVKDAEIAERLGITYKAVRSLVRQKQLAAPDSRRHIWREGEVAQVRELRMAGLTRAEIAKRLAVSTNSIKHLTRSRRIIHPDYVNKECYKWTDGKLEELRKLKEASVTNKEIARRLNVTVNSVGYAVSLYHFLRPVPPPVTDEDVEKAEEMMRDGLTYQMIAERLGCSRNVILHAIYKRGLKYFNYKDKIAWRKYREAAELLAPYYDSWEMGYIIGVMWVGKKSRRMDIVQIRAKREADLTFTAKVMEKLTGQKPWVGIGSTGYWELRLRKNRVHIVNALYERWRKFHNNPRKDYVTIEHRRYRRYVLTRAYSQSIKSRVARNKEFWRGVLQGAFDTRGYITNKYSQTKLRLRVYGWKLWPAMHQLLYAFGIRSYLYCRPMAINRKDFQQFAKEIGFRDEEKRKRLKELLSSS